VLLQSIDPVVVSIIEAENISTMLQVTSEWDDLVDIQIVPAITKEQGMALPRKMMYLGRSCLYKKALW